MTAPTGHWKSKRKKHIYFNKFTLFQLAQTSNEFNKCYAKGLSVGAIKEEEWDAIATITKTHVLLMTSIKNSNDTELHSARALDNSIKSATQLSIQALHYTIS